MGSRLHKENGRLAWKRVHPDPWGTPCDSGDKTLKKLIVTADDFGISIGANRAIEEAHRHGILTAASLMVGADAAADAVDRAKRLPTLRVGLHLVLLDGAPVLPAAAIPDLLNREGLFSSHLVRAGVKLAFSLKARRQLEAEVRAQFQAFQKTGLPLDHVNSHHHFHLHPTLLGVLLKVGKEFGFRAVRFPYEPPIPSWRASRKDLLLRLGAWLLLCPWIMFLKIRLSLEKVGSNDFVFGMIDSGSMTPDLVHRFLKYLPHGVTEIYFHPALSEMDRERGTHRPEKEFEALTSPEIRQALRASQIQMIAFSDLP
jgi:hopanoid biosynthesis associated protein HpnK